MTEWPTVLRPGEVDVCYQPTEAFDEVDVEQALAILSPGEQQRFRFERDRRDYAAAHALLR